MHLVIVSGTVFGTADLVADEAQNFCEAGGLKVSRLKALNLDALLALQPEALLVCTSTTGMGELPEPLVPLFHEMRDRFPLFTAVPFGVIALGDAAYGDTFCQAGEEFCGRSARLISWGFQAGARRWQAGSVALHPESVSGRIEYAASLDPPDALAVC